jgi:hypothetical protein
MRDPRIARRKERRHRRDRRLAGRRIALFASFVDGFSRLVAATLSASSCFVLWDLVARNPGAIARNASEAFRRAGPAARGLLRFAVGLVFAVLALALVATVADARDFSAVAIAVFLAALGVDALIGDAIRAGIGIHR